MQDVDDETGRRANRLNKDNREIVTDRQRLARMNSNTDDKMDGNRGARDNRTDVKREKEKAKRMGQDVTDKKKSRGARTPIRHKASQH